MLRRAIGATLLALCTSVQAQDLHVQNTLEQYIAPARVHFQLPFHLPKKTPDILPALVYDAVRAAVDPDFYATKALNQVVNEYMEELQRGAAALHDSGQYQDNEIDDAAAHLHRLPDYGDLKSIIVDDRYKLTTQSGGQSHTIAARQIIAFFQPPNGPLFKYTIDIPLDSVQVIPGGKVDYFSDTDAIVAEEIVGTNKRKILSNNIMQSQEHEQLTPVQQEFQQKVREGRSPPRIP